MLPAKQSSAQTEQARKRLQFAKLGEKLAADYLLQLNYRLIDQNVKIGSWEIDLIAESNLEIVFVEVKTTTKRACRPEDRLSSGQQKRLFQAAERWLIVNKLEARAARFDLIVVEINDYCGENEITHHIDALRWDKTLGN